MSKKAIEWEWEKVCSRNNDDDYTERMRVPGGWVVRSQTYGVDDGRCVSCSESSVFVPYPPGSVRVVGRDRNWTTGENPDSPGFYLCSMLVRAFPTVWTNEVNLEDGGPEPLHVVRAWMPLPEPIK